MPILATNKAELKLYFKILQNRFAHNAALPNQYRPNIPNQKKYRPQRASAGNQQIRISRPFSQGTEAEQNSKFT